MNRGKNPIDHSVAVKERVDKIKSTHCLFIAKYQACVFVRHTKQCCTQPNISRGIYSNMEHIPAQRMRRRFTILQKNGAKSDIKIYQRLNLAGSWYMVP